MADFEDGKDESALRTIGEVSEALGIKPHVLRYWEQQFSLLSPLKRSGGRRYYRPNDVSLVEEINRLVNDEGYTLKGAEAVLRGSGRPGADRRQSERRAAERRMIDVDDGAVGEADPAHASAPASETETLQTPAPAPAPAHGSANMPADMADALDQLKAIRKRLARAIDA